MLSPHRSATTVWGIPLKQLTIIALVVQNSALILIMHYSRVMPLVNGQRYLASSAVFMNEVFKLTISLTMALYETATNANADTSTAAGLFGGTAKEVFTGDGWKLAIPAVLYTLQNSLQYIALGNLDAATFQVTYQLKILTTALFSGALLQRSFSTRKWASLLVLTAGVALLYLPLGGTEAPVLSIKDLKDGAAFHEARSVWDLQALGAEKLTKRSATYEGIDEDFAAANPRANTVVGFVTALLSAVLSGLAGVYFEKILKEPKSERKASVWVRNVQLSFYSLWPALLIGVWAKDGDAVAENGFFVGWNWVVWTLVVVQAVGGILVALVVKHADNITKNFAASISIIVSFTGSVIFFDFPISFSYMAGAFTVLSATWLYYEPESNKLRPPQIQIPESEKGSGGSYFDIESVATPARSPLRDHEALSTSRPGTPAFERRAHLPRTKSFEMRLGKRDA